MVVGRFGSFLVPGLFSSWIFFNPWKFDGWMDILKMMLEVSRRCFLSNMGVHFKKGMWWDTKVGHFEDIIFTSIYEECRKKTDQLDKVVSRKKKSFRVVSRLGVQKPTSNCRGWILWAWICFVWMLSPAWNHFECSCYVMWFTDLVQNDPFTMDFGAKNRTLFWN